MAENSTTNEFMVPTDPEKLISWLERKRESGKPRMPDIQMKLNLLFVLGQQWVVWDSDKRTFRKPPSRTNDPNAPVRITANKIGGIMERFIARLVKAAPEPECRPVTDDESDIGAAKAGTRILRSEMNRLDWELWLVRHYFWITTLGFGYAQVTWDAARGEVLGTVDESEVRIGDITLECVPAFELSVDPNADSMLTARWAVRTRTMTKEAVWEKWGVVPKTDTAKRTVAEEAMSLIDAGSATKDQDTKVNVHQLWMLPCRAAPQGMVITWCGTAILEPPKPFPYEHKRLPFVQFDLLPGMGSREGRTWVNDLIPLQSDYNDARSREAMIRRTLVPKLIAPVGSIDPARLTTRVETILVNPVGSEPKLMIPDSGWMGQYETSMNRADMEMGDRAGQSDVSSGKPASASMPAAAILALQEADDTKLAISAKLMADAIKEIGAQMLALVQQFWSEDRLVRTWSEEGTLEVAQFSGADIAGQLDVHVASESSLPRSKSAVVQLGLDLWREQIITDPRYVLRLIKVPGTDFLADAYNVDTRQAQRENDSLAQGQMIEVNPFDNHMVHITEHDNFRKGEEYGKLKQRAQQGDQEAALAVQTLDAHAQVHYEMVLPQMGVPTPPGTPFMPNAPGTSGPGPESVGGEYLDPLTGKPPDPTQVAAGQTPSALAFSRYGGIGGAGQPGAVPGVPADQQAEAMGN